MNQYKRPEHKHNHGFTLFYHIEQAFSGLWSNRTMTVASVLVLAACLLVIGSFYLVICNINYNTSDFSHLNKVIAYVNEDYTEKEVGTVKITIEQWADMVEGVTLVTKEQALAEEKEKYKEDYPHMFDVLEEDENPYRDSLEITYLEGTSVSELSKKLSAVVGVERVVAYQDIADSVTQLKGIISKVFTVFIAILFVVTIFVIILTIRFVVVSHREEVKIMRYVGATIRFVAAPYIIEGVIIGLVAAIIASLTQGFVYGQLSKAMMGALTAMPYSDVSGILFAGFLAVGIVTGIIGSCISLVRYLHV